MNNISRKAILYLVIVLFTFGHALASDPYDNFYKSLREEDYKTATELLEELDESEDPFRRVSASINLLIKTGKRELALKEIDRLMLEYDDDDRLAGNVFTFGIMLGVENKRYYSKIFERKGSLDGISGEPLLMGFMAFLYPIVYDSENSDLIEFYEKDDFIDLILPEKNDEDDSTLEVDLSAFRSGKDNVIIDAITSRDGSFIVESNYLKVCLSRSETRDSVYLKLDQKFPNIERSSLLEIKIRGENLIVRMGEKNFEFIPQIGEVYSLRIPGAVVSFGRDENIEDKMAFRVRVEWFDDGYKTTAFNIYESIPKSEE